MAESQNKPAAEAQSATPTEHKYVREPKIRIWNDLNWSPVLNREKTARVAVVNTEVIQVSAQKHSNADADTTDEEAEEEQEAEVDDAEILSDLPDDIDVRIAYWSRYTIVTTYFVGNQLDPFKAQHRQQSRAAEVHETQQALSEAEFHIVAGR